MNQSFSSKRCSSAKCDDVLQNLLRNNQAKIYMFQVQKKNQVVTETGSMRTKKNSFFTRSMSGKNSTFHSGQISPILYTPKSNDFSQSSKDTKKSLRSPYQLNSEFTGVSFNIAQDRKQLTLNDLNNKKKLIKLVRADPTEEQSSLMNEISVSHISQQTNIISGIDQTTQVSGIRNLLCESARFNICANCLKKYKNSPFREKSVYEIQKSELREQQQRLLAETIRKDKKIYDLEARLKTLQNGTIFKSLQSQIQSLSLEKEILIRQSEEKIRIQREEFQNYQQNLHKQLQLLEQQLSSHEGKQTLIDKQKQEIQDLKNKCNQILEQYEQQKMQHSETNSLMKSVFQFLEQIQEQTLEFKSKLFFMYTHAKQLREIIQYLIQRQDPPLEILINKPQEQRRSVKSLGSNDKDKNNILKQFQIEIKSQIECNIVIQDCLKILSETISQTTKRYINELGKNLVSFD